MPLMIQRIARGLLPPLDPTRPRMHNAAPERIVFDVKPGVTPSELPPVKIFLGSERGQFRAERVFLWSVAKHRDPTRVYEVVLMRHFAGYNDRFWLTAFTNYRFAVPALCAYQGRAIYNDVDQVYLTDPAALFDLDMQDAGFLSINDRDTSVMLIDCARMADIWTDAAARRDKRSELESKARAGQRWGPLSPAWNARDQEYQPGASCLVHFTTLHTQPWRPFPEQFVYFDNPTAQLWPDLEAEATAAGFMPVNAQRPSQGWNAAQERLGAFAAGQQLLELLRKPASVGAPSGALQLHNALELVPDLDLPWVLERLFAGAASLELRVDEPWLERDGRHRRSIWFWRQQLNQAAQLFPEVRWRLQRRCLLRTTRLQGGPARDGAIVALIHAKPGHDHQSLAVAGALAAQTGRELRRHRIPWSAAGYVLRRLLGHAALDDVPADTAVIVAAGWLPTRVARCIPGAPRLVLLGRKAGQPPKEAGAVVQCRHFGLPPHPNRITTLLPLNNAVTARPASEERWRDWLSAAHRLALLVGGSSRSHRLDGDAAFDLGRAASDWAREHQGRLLVVTGRRTGASASRQLAAALRDDDALYLWQADAADNPYALALNHADTLVVTGESESMLADAVASGRPVLIWPLAARRPSPWRALCTWTAERAMRPRYNRRGSIRPQQSLAYLCGRLIERGLILPPRNLDVLHDALFYRGLAARFGQAEPKAPVAFKELDLVARQLAERLGLGRSLTEAVIDGASNGKQP